VRQESFDDVSLIMEALMDVRERVTRILDLLEGESDGEEEADDA
jgi:hypothetical protein